jgi:hypothetical protein
MDTSVVQTSSIIHDILKLSDTDNVPMSQLEPVQTRANTQMVTAIKGPVGCQPYAAIGRFHDTEYIQELWIGKPFFLACNTAQGSLNIFKAKHCRVERPNRVEVSVSRIFVRRLQEYLIKKQRVMDDIDMYLGVEKTEKVDNVQKVMKKLKKSRHIRVGKKMFNKRARAGKFKFGEYVVYLDGCEIIDGRKFVRGFKAPNYQVAVQWARDHANKDGYTSSFYCHEFTSPPLDLTDSDDDEEYPDDPTDDILEDYVRQNRHLRVGTKFFNKRASAGECKHGEYVVYLDGYERLDDKLDGKKVVRGFKAPNYQEAMKWIKEHNHPDEIDGFTGRYFCQQFIESWVDKDNIRDDEFPDDPTCDSLEEYVPPKPVVKGEETKAERAVVRDEEAYDFVEDDETDETDEDEMETDEKDEKAPSLPEQNESREFTKSDAFYRDRTNQD